MFRRLIASFVCLTFIVSTCPTVFAQEFSIRDLPVPGTMVSVSPSFEPALIKGLTVHKDNPFLFDFIVDPGQSKYPKEVLKDESLRMIKYFFAALTIPDKDIWVNLSPYEKDRMVPVSLGETAMGRDLLAQDYLLKQLTASLIYPQKALGKTFWDTVYSKAKAMYGTTQIPVNTFNKVWIVPQRVGVYEHNQTAFIVDGHLKVMLEEDYLSMTKHNAMTNPSQQNLSSTNNKDMSFPNVSIGNPDKAHTIASNIIRQIILPEIEKEINEGKNFATLRQIFYAQALAVWFKRNLKQALLNRVYANKGTVKGIDQNDAATNEAIYHQYLKAYKKGVFNFIKEDKIPYSFGSGTGGQTIARKYFSGGYSGKDISEAMVAVQLSPMAAGDKAQAANLIDVQAVAEVNPEDAAVLATNAGREMAGTQVLDAAMVVEGNMVHFGYDINQTIPKKAVVKILDVIKEGIKNGAVKVQDAQVDLGHGMANHQVIGFTPPATGGIITKPEEVRAYMAIVVEIARSLRLRNEMGHSNGKPLLALLSNDGQKDLHNVLKNEVIPQIDAMSSQLNQANEYAAISGEGKSEDAFNIHNDDDISQIIGIFPQHKALNLMLQKDGKNVFYQVDVSDGEAGANRGNNKNIKLTRDGEEIVGKSILFGRSFKISSFNLDISFIPHGNTANRVSFNITSDKPYTVENIPRFEFLHFSVLGPNQETPGKIIVNNEELLVWSSPKKSNAAMTVDEINTTKEATISKIENAPNTAAVGSIYRQWFEFVRSAYQDGDDSIHTALFSANDKVIEAARAKGLVISDAAMNTWIGRLRAHLKQKATDFNTIARGLIENHAVPYVKLKNDTKQWHEVNTSLREIIFDVIEKLTGQRLKPLQTVDVMRQKNEQNEWPQNKVLINQLLDLLSETTENSYKFLDLYVVSSGTGRKYDSGFFMSEEQRARIKLSEITADIKMAIEKLSDILSHTPDLEEINSKVVALKESLPADAAMNAIDEYVKSTDKVRFGSKDARTAGELGEYLMEGENILSSEGFLGLRDRFVYDSINSSTDQLRLAITIQSTAAHLMELDEKDIRNITGEAIIRWLYHSGVLLNMPNGIDAAMNTVEYRALNANGKWQSGEIPIYGSFGKTKNLREVIKDVREALGLSRLRVAKLAEISEAYVAKIEDGIRGVPSERVTERIQEALGIQDGDLLALRNTEREGFVDRRRKSAGSNNPFIGIVKQLKEQHIERLLRGHVEKSIQDTPDNYKESIRNHLYFLLGLQANDADIATVPEVIVNDAVLKLLTFLNSDLAMRGGIDLSQQDAALHVVKDANGGVVVNVDPALIARIEREGMPEVVPVIINMQPADIRSLFGVEASV